MICRPICRKMPGIEKSRENGLIKMEVYKRETEEIIRRFKNGRLGFPDCMAALDAALAGVIPGLTAAEIEDLRTVMMSNNDTVMSEMEKRGQRRRGKAAVSAV